MTVTTLQQQNFQLFNQLIDTDELEAAGSMTLKFEEDQDVRMSVICFNGSCWHIALNQYHSNLMMKMQLIIAFEDQTIELISTEYNKEYRSKHSGTPVKELDQTLNAWLKLIEQAT